MYNLWQSFKSHLCGLFGDAAQSSTESLKYYKINFK
jgi:hypothetical protein